ncbi:MAG TPA: adenylate kinase [Candidatus Thermoplasmatota archaeon]|nr:adenylate kinase [Candidatus Thermoplasmatota archaeon]
MGAIIVTGIPGVGKTTVMEAAAKARSLKVAVYGSVMFEVASAKGLVQSRDEMRKLPADTQKSIQKEAARRIAAMGDVIVDTHCSIKTPTGYLPGLPAWVLAELQPSAVVLVEADPREILGRRQGDATRKRDEDSLEAIAEHQEYNRRFAAAYATLTGATVHTVHNKDGGVEAALQQMMPVLGGPKAGAAGAKPNVPVGAR